MYKFLFMLWPMGLLLSGCQGLLFEEEPANDPISNFESIWETFETRYAVFEQRNIDWNALYDQYRPQVTAATSDEELYNIITDMLAHLNDGHVSLMATGKPFWSGYDEYRERTYDFLLDLGVVQDYLDAPFTIKDNQQYFIGTIDNEIGYLFINHLQGDPPVALIDDFVAQMKDMRGIIIDLRHNGGGDFTNGEIIASRFAGASTLAFTGQAKSGPGPDDYAEAVDYFIAADGPQQFTKPVVVLMDRYTISAGENLVLYLRVLPQCTLIGENTVGAMGERIEKEMPNGWIYSITGQIMTAADGVSYEGPGITPDIAAMNTFEEMDLRIDRVLETAIDKIRE